MRAPRQQPHCFDETGMCGCKPVTKNLCPCCEGIGVIDTTHPDSHPEEIIPVIVHRYKGKVCYGERPSY